MKISEMVREAGLTTRVPYQATCASACVLVFAAGLNRIAHADAKLAVHSAGMPAERGDDKRMVENDLSCRATFPMRWPMGGGAGAGAVARRVCGTLAGDFPRGPSGGLQRKTPNSPRNSAWMRFR